MKLRNSNDHYQKGLETDISKLNFLAPNSNERNFVFPQMTQYAISLIDYFVLDIKPNSVSKHGEIMVHIELKNG